MLRNGPDITALHKPFKRTRGMGKALVLRQDRLARQLELPEKPEMMTTKDTIGDSKAS